METKKLKLIKCTELFKLTVTEHLEKIIRFLCDKLPANEWSGTLFYTVEGSFEDGTLHIIAKDFYLQDVGEGTYTEFQHDATLAGYMVENDLLDCYTGLMHSHNSMQAFFSGTDTNTLLSEGSTTNHFVSLIVNNRGEYCAAITKKAKTVYEGNSNIFYNSFNNIQINSSKPFRFENIAIEYYLLDIENPNIEITKSPLEIRLEELRKSSKSTINKNRLLWSSPYDESNRKLLMEPNTFSMETPKEPIKIDKKESYTSTVEPEIPENVISEKEILDSVKQIVTCDIFGHYRMALDLNKWASNMEVLFNKRFGVKDNDNDVPLEFTNFIDLLSEFIFGEIYDNIIFSNKYDADLLSEDEIYAEWSYKVIDKLNDLPTNKYLNYIITALNK